MRILLDFWKKDIINKIIVILAGLLGLGVLGILILVVFIMPSSKSLNGAFAAYFPSPTPGLEQRMTKVASEGTQRAIDATASVPPSPTTMQFTPFVPSKTPKPSQTPLLATIPLNPPTQATSGISDTNTPAIPTTTPTLIPPAPTATRPQPTSAHPSATLPPAPTVTPFPPGFTPSPTPTAVQGLACIPNNPWQTGKVLSVLDGDTLKVLINGFAYNVRYIGVQIPTNKHYATLAAVTNNGLAFAKQVTLIPDSVDKDPSGYLLRYVVVDESMPALEMVKNGILPVADIPTGFACSQTFLAAQQAAQDQKIGIWATPTGP